MIQATGVQAFRQNFPSFVGQTGLAGLNFNLPITLGMKNTQKTGLVPVAAYRFTGAEFSSTDRYPQGVTAIGDFILTSFYFNVVPLKDAAKLVVINRAGTPAAGNLGLLQRQPGGLFGRINTHAGGIEIFAGRYLFVENSYLGCLHIFDLQSVFPKAGNEQFIDMVDIYSAQFEHFLPEVGRITLNATTNLGSVGKCGEDSVVLANFWIPGSQYSAGGKTMVWKLRLDDDQYEFPAPLLTTVADQFDPLYPPNCGADAGLNLDKVQGVLWMENDVVILSRSYGSGTKQLTLLYRPNPSVYYNGNATYPTGYDWKNWIYGCEDLSLTDNGEIITVAEFIGWRDVTIWRLNDVLGLVDLPLPPTIAEHEAALLSMNAQIAALQDEAFYYDLQISSAIAQNLDRFDRLTFVP